MKKNWIIFVLVLVLLVPCFSGCYVVNAGKLADVVGVYELYQYNSTASDDSEGNFMESKGVMSYLVISGEGRGYYFYKDNKTEAFCREIDITLTPDDEDPSLYSYVNYRFDTQTGYTKLGINAKQHRLNARIPQWKGNIFKGDLTIDHYVNTIYKRISKKAETSVVTKLWGEVPTLIYGDGIAHGVFTYDNTTTEMVSPDQSVTEPYVYYVMDVNMLNKTADVYYMLKSDEIAHKETELAVTMFANTASQNGTLTIGNNSYEMAIYPNDSYTLVNLAQTQQGGTVEEPMTWTYNFSHWTDSSYDIPYIMADAIRAYNESKTA